MKKAEFIKAVGIKPTTTKQAVELADVNNISFARRNAHLKAWFGKGNGNVMPSRHNLIG